MLIPLFLQNFQIEVFYICQLEALCNDNNHYFLLSVIKRQINMQFKTKDSNSS